MRRVRRFFSRWQNWVGTLLVLSFTFMALAAPILSPANARTQGAFMKVGRSSDFVPHPPSDKAILGTLPGQFDVFHALVWGARDAMQFGLLVAIFAFLLGIILGSTAGFIGGPVNGLMMRITDAFLTFPVLAGVVFLQQLLAVTIESLGGIYWFNNDYFGKVVDFQFTPPPFALFLLKVDPILISLIIFSWMPTARIVNTLVITLKNAEFIQAARALGASPFRIIVRHLLPNSMGPAMVLAARDVGSSVILQATITFIGLGGASPWGILLSLGRNWIIGPGGDLLATWWVFLPATFAIVLFGVGWNLIGDGLAEALEPSAITYEGTSYLKFKKASIKFAPQVVHRTINPVMGLKSSNDGTPDKHPLLQIARDEIARQNIDQALNIYCHLIKRHRHVVEVRQDLIQISRRIPNHAIVWTLLGDALTQEGNYEFAKKAYEQARKLTQ